MCRPPTPRILALLTALAATPALALGDDDVRREATGQRAADLTAMELKPFAGELLGGLADWQNGEAPTFASLKGKPVLIVTWTAWIPSSQQLVEKAAAAAQANPDLVVILVHADQRYELATKWLTDKGIKLLCARDAGGKFRAGIKADTDPDLYVIDRAGHLRFADVETASLTAAVDKVHKESTSDAEGAPAAVAEARRLAELEAQRTRELVKVLQPNESIKVDFEAPNAIKYAAVIWPPVNQDKDINTIANKDIQGALLKADLSTGTWLTPMPDLRGKVVVVYFWSTVDDHRRWEPTLEALARKYRRDLVILAVGGMKQDETRFDTRAAVEKFIRARTAVEFSYLYDNEQKIYQGMQMLAWPAVLICSTDGVVRWCGHPFDPEMQERIEQVIALDPGVAARRAAELKEIQKRGQ